MEVGLEWVSLGPNGYFRWPTCHKKGFKLPFSPYYSFLVSMKILVQNGGPPGLSNPHFLGATVGIGLGGGGVRILGHLLWGKLN